MKFYNLEGKVVTLPANIGTARRCFFMKEKLDRKAAGPSEISGKEGRKKQPKVEDDLNMINLSASDPEKGTGNQAKRMKREKGVPSLEAGDPLDCLAEAFARAVSLRPGFPKEDRNEKDRRVTEKHLLKMKRGQRLLKSGNHRSGAELTIYHNCQTPKYKEGAESRTRKVQMTPPQKAYPLVLKRSLLHIAKKRKPFQKEGKSAGKAVRRLADMRGALRGAEASVRILESDDVMEVVSLGAQYYPGGKGARAPYFLLA